MPAGNITQAERQQRMMSIKSLLDDGKTKTEIAEEMGMPIQTVKSNIKYLEDLMVADLKPEQIAEKRQEIYTELIELTIEARDQFMDLKSTDPKAARSFWSAWKSAIDDRAELFGLKNFDNGPQVQFNTQNNISNVPDILPAAAQEKLSKMIIEHHEKKLKEQT